MRTIDTPEGVTFGHAIPVHRLPELRQRFEALAKRAAKLGVEAPCFEVVGHRLKIERHEVTGSERCREYELVVVRGPVVKLAGWTFVASVEHTGSGNLIRKAPSVGFELPKNFWTDPPTCDHCRTFRNRKDTFVVRHDDGRFARVGRRCLHDFLGVDGDDAAALCEFALSLEDGFDEDGLGGWNNGPTGFSVVEFLSFCAAMIRMDCGYRSRARFEESSTADRALRAMFPGTRPARESQSVRTPYDDEVAARVLAWGRSLPEDGISDYLQNVRVVCNLDWMQEKHAGIVASAVSAFVRDAERRAERDAVLCEPLAPAGTKIGGTKLTKKERLAGREQLPPVRAKLLRTHSFDGLYGTTILHVFSTEEGHRLVWWATLDAAHSFSWEPRFTDDGKPAGEELVVEPGTWCWLGGAVRSVGPNKWDGKTETVLVRVARCTDEHVAEWRKEWAP
jgi:hypothetical protein